MKCTPFVLFTIDKACNFSVNLSRDETKEEIYKL